MKKTALLWSGLLIFGTGAGWAQQAPASSGGPDGPAEMGEDRGPMSAPFPAGGTQMPEGMGPGQGWGGEPGAGRPHGRLGEPRELSLTDAQEKELRAFVKTNDPHMDENLTADKTKRPPFYRHQISGLWTMYMQPEGRQRWVKQVKARREVADLTAQYNLADDAGKPAVKEKLAKAVGELFDADLEEKGNQVHALETQAALLKDKIAKRAQAKDKIVAQRVDGLTGEADDWSW